MQQSQGSSVTAMFNSVLNSCMIFVMLAVKLQFLRVVKTEKKRCICWKIRLTKCQLCMKYYMTETRDVSFTNIIVDIFFSGTFSKLCTFHCSFSNISS